jgi:hypothetical protein
VRLEVLLDVRGGARGSVSRSPRWRISSSGPILRVTPPFEVTSTSPVKAENFAVAVARSNDTAASLSRATRASAEGVVTRPPRCAVFRSTQPYSIEIACSLPAPIALRSRVTRKRVLGRTV